MKYDVRLLFNDGQLIKRTFGELHKAEAWVARSVKQAATISPLTRAPGHVHWYPSSAVTLATVTERS